MTLLLNWKKMVPKIYTSAFAEKRVEPNMARVTFAVLTRASQAEKARNENARGSGKVPLENAVTSA